MFGWLKKVAQKVTPVYPLRLSKEELTKIFQEQQVCPDCGVWDFREGPSGGMSVNIYCANCGSWFNEQGPFGLERLFKHTNFDWREKEIRGRKNYTDYTWEILKTWHRVEFEGGTSPDRRVFHDAIEEFTYGSFEGLTGRWSVKDYTLYFEDETDAVAVKLRWT